MDYTTLERVKLEMQSNKGTQDALLGKLITAASRAIDRKCTGVPDGDAVDYFKLETRTAEILNGQIDNQGMVLVYPHKPLVETVTAFKFRPRPIDEWTVVDVSRVSADGPSVEAYPVSVMHVSKRCKVEISYTGGLADEVAELPEDLVELATILTVRFYKEAESGLNDSVGIAELGVMIYSKAWPVRVTEQIQPFIRRVGWRLPA